MISHVKGGSDRSPEELKGLTAFMAAVDARTVSVLFPTFLRSELLECNLPPGGVDLFERFLDRRNVEEVPVNTEIAKIANVIRNFHLAAHKKKPNKIALVSIIDAHFLATAIHYGSKVLYTYDGAREKPNAQPRNLLKLSGLIAGKYPLTIRMPDGEPILV
jgi:predicted nucleic acid-binding protein